MTSLAGRPFLLKLKWLPLVSAWRQRKERTETQVIGIYSRSPAGNSIALNPRQRNGQHRFPEPTAGASPGGDAQESLRLPERGAALGATPEPDLRRRAGFQKW